MNELVTIFFSMALINNFILVRFLGLCPFFGVSKKTSSAFKMGLAVLLVMIATSIVTWSLYKFVLEPLSVEFMRTMVFILVIASLVQILELTIRRTSISLYKILPEEGIISKRLVVLFWSIWFLYLVQIQFAEFRNYLFLNALVFMMERVNLVVVQFHNVMRDILDLN